MGEADAIEARLRALSDTERAEAEKRYLKSELEHIGVSVPATRRVAKEFLRDRPGLSAEELGTLVEELWAAPVHERRLAAALMLQARPRLVGPELIPLLERLIRDSRTWALVDVLAGDVLGGLVVRHPGLADRIEPWVADPDFWVRRSVLLAQREPLRQGAPFDRFAGYADTMLDEHEFFIRKAIGWVLREQSRRRPDEVYEWLLPRTGRISGVTIREAIKYLPGERRERLMEAYRQGDR